MKNKNYRRDKEENTFCYELVRFIKEADDKLASKRKLIVKI